MSISGGFYKALLRGEELGCTAIQIFTKNSNQWQAKELSSEDIKRFKNTRKKTNIKTVVAHDSYLINLGSKDRELLGKSKNSLLFELSRTENLGAKYLVMHPGSNPDEVDGIKRIADCLNWIHHKAPEYKAKICLETTAGQGNALGWRFEHLAQIIDSVEEKSRLGVCYDTSHTFTAGYDIRDKEAYIKTFREFDRIIGLRKLMVFHLNDSKKNLGTRVDRHEHIGRGFLGLEAFRMLMNDTKFKKIPKIIETPQELNRDGENLKLLKSLVKEE